jgi:TRAP-type mannitol/chloroaromatic compound transport system permease small subunit
MKRLLRLADAIDRFSDRTGQLLRWLTLAMVLVGAFNALVRYTARFTGLSLSSNMYIELQWYLFAALFMLGVAYALRTDSHVRVDVLYGRVGDRGRAWIDLSGTILFLIPFCVMMLVVSWPAVMNSWEVLEQSPDPGGLPRYPLKTVIPVAFVLLLVQGISMLIRAIAVLTGDHEGPYPPLRAKSEVA